MSVRTRRPSALSFGAYQLLERLRGPSLTERHRALSADGMFVVLHVVRPELAKDFAFRSLFQVQAQKAQALTHPNIAKIVDFGEADGRWYLAVEEVTGEDLATRLAAMRARGERLARRDVRAIVHDVAAGLAYAHEQGVVHGDLRPGNVILSSSGAAVLTGLVIARSLRTDVQDRIAVAAFAPAFMAPEQSEGKAPDQRTDIYALGVLTYELLAGRPPYVGETPLAVLLAHGREPLPLPSQVEPSIGAPLERVLLRALAVDPSARHPDARSFVASLDEAFEEDARRPATAFVVVPPGAAATAVAPSRARTWLRGPYALLVAGGAGLLVLGIALGALVARPATIATAPVATAAVASPLPTAPVALPTPPLVRPPVPTPAFTPPPLPPPSPTFAPQPPSPIPPPVPPRGQLLYQAKLDGTRELDDLHVFSGGPSDAAIRMTRGAIELEVVRRPGGAEAFFPIAARTSYIGEFSVVVPAGSQALVTWALRRDGDASYLLRLDGATETLSLVYDDGTRLREALAPQARIQGLRSGRTVSLTIAVSGTDLSIYLDGGLVMQARDARIKTATLPPDIFVGEEGGVGLVRLTAARLYAVP